MIGDFLSVSKIAYGVRAPQTPVAVPFVHNKLPKTEIKSYSEAVKLPYIRSKALKPVRNNDVVYVPFSECIRTDKRFDKRLINVLDELSI